MRRYVKVRGRLQPARQGDRTGYLDAPTTSSTRAAMPSYPQYDCRQLIEASFSSTRSADAPKAAMPNRPHVSIRGGEPTERPPSRPTGSPVRVRHHDTPQTTLPMTPGYRIGRPTSTSTAAHPASRRERHASSRQRARQAAGAHVLWTRWCPVLLKELRIPKVRWTYDAHGKSESNRVLRPLTIDSSNAYGLHHKIVYDKPRTGTTREFLDVDGYRCTHGWPFGNLNPAVTASVSGSRGDLAPPNYDGEELGNTQFIQ